MASQNTHTSSADRTLAQDLASAFDWWREAGVDCDFLDEPLDRFAEALAEATAAQEASKQAESKPPLPPAKAAPRAFAPQVDNTAKQDFTQDRQNWPQDIESFANWWASEAARATIGGGQGVRPHGAENADLMIVVSQPEEMDKAALLSGPHGKLVSGFLRAANIDPANAYFASSLPCRSELPDWRALRDAGLGDILCHHIALAKPKRVLALGRNILPLLGHDQAQGPAQVTLAQGNGAQVPIFAAPGPDELLRSAPRRKRLWHDWLDWSA